MVGYRDILGFVALPLSDRAIVLEVLQRASQLQAARRADERDDLARRLAHRMFR